MENKTDNRRTNFVNENVPLILSIESSGTTCGVALSNGDIIISDYSIFGRNVHDKMLAELTRRILNDNNLTISDINLIALSAGPGSFTGLRIGAALAKALCFDEGPKMIAVPTLFAIAYDAACNANLNAITTITAVVAAYKDLYYFQKFNPITFECEEIIQTSTDELHKLNGEDNLVAGELTFGSGEILNLHKTKLSPMLIAKAGYKLYKEEKLTDAETFVPLYVQDFQVKTSTKKLNIKGDS